MHKLYFTRHGETVWNVENKICGMTDSPLTERGRAQARALGQKVKAGGYAIDEILYSPLSRAADTAKAIADATGIPARCEPRLREQCFGKYEGTPRNGEKFRISKTCFADRYDGGESMLAAGPAHLQPAGRTAGPTGQDLPVGGPQRHRPGGGVLLPRHDQRRIRPGWHPQLRAGGVSF